MKAYTTVKKENNAEFVERKSRFIGYACPVKTADEALEFIAKIKAMHKQATHNVWCYNLKNGERRYSDDGEPQGTAGVPSLDVAFAGLYDAFTQKNAVIIGVSKDSQASHRKFAEKNGLPFILLSDTELDAIQKYGVWQEKKLYGKVSMGVVRSSFVINEDGILERVLYKVKADTNAQDILDGL